MNDSSNSAKDFLNAVDSNPALQNQLQQAQANIVKLGAEHGYDFTLDDLHNELRDRWAIEKPADDPNTCTVTVP